jgi:hypothetical protein
MTIIADPTTMKVHRWRPAVDQNAYTVMENANVIIDHDRRTRGRLRKKERVLRLRNFLVAL